MTGKALAVVPPITVLGVKVRVNADIRNFDRDLSDEAQIATNYEALNEEIAKNPGRFAIWAVLEAMARKVVDAMIGKVNDLKIEMSDLDSELTVEYAGTGTVAVVAAKVVTDARHKAKQKEIQAAEAAVREAKADLELLIAGRKTMEQRRDSLLALASNWRQEQQSRIQLRAYGAPGQDRPLAGQQKGR